ncbi:RNA polymerase sigma factor [Kineothrix sedimenti]|uniref:RNA polymerase sigma factor n=1 Tax=Kineothrix sedimenti TaxID=3123317 RepID=A0ABZ3EWC5_9FIRM
MEELRLVQQLKGGDKAAFDALYENYKNILLRMAYLVSGNRNDAEDIVQETFVKCYLHIGELKKDEGFRPWLFQILYRTAYRQTKKRGREIPDEDIDMQAEATDGVTSLDKLVRNETEKMISDAVQGLDIKHRTVIVLYYYNELSAGEIAKVIGCTQGTVKSRLHNARKKLKGILKAQEEGGKEYEKQKGLHYS